MSELIKIGEIVEEEESDVFGDSFFGDGVLEVRVSDSWGRVKVLYDPDVNEYGKEERYSLYLVKD